ncbi:MAG: adenylyl-sulfate kinase [Acidobacteriaceae bacterium]
MTEHDKPGTGRIKRTDWEQHLGHRAAIAWLTGLPGSGKSTIAYALEQQLYTEGRRVVVLDGDRVRSGLSRDLGFSDDDRHEQLRRVGEVAALFVETGTIVIAALITPRAADRAWLRQRFAATDLLEVYCRCPASVCAERDPKGHYARAKAGSMSGFTGVSAPYEPPAHPDLILDTDQRSVQECVDTVLDAFQRRGVWMATPENTRKRPGGKIDRHG